MKEDPLAPFLEYIQWTKEHFPTGHKSIMAVTEDALRKFRKNPTCAPSLADLRFKNDLRFIQLWMDVGKKQKDPSDLVRL
jgi:hypothetical protein